MKTPVVTIVGRPNVGKSTLFNKLAGLRIAIEDPTAGTTRDRIFHKIESPVMDFFLVDTGGLEFTKGETSIEDDMHAQAKTAIQESDLVLFVLSAQEPLTRDDIRIAELLREKNNRTPVILIINKCDRERDVSELAEYYQLGLGEPRQISATHRAGIDFIHSEIIKTLTNRHFLTKDSPDFKKEDAFDQSHPNIALAGRPNVGKSSLINALLNKEKLIVSEIPGTTRDSTDSLVRHNGKDYNFIDTAGLRRRGRIERGIEKFSALRSMSSIERSDITLLILDGSQKIAAQDQQIARYIVEAGKCVIIVVTKWDIKDEEAPKEEERRAKKLGELRFNFPFLSWAPVIFTSAVTKKNLPKVFEQIEVIYAEKKKRIQTSHLNDFLEKAIAEHKPTGTSATRPKILYMTQVETEPPQFIVFVNKKSAFHFSYIRYLENRLRETFGFTGTPLRLEYKERKSQL